MKGTIGSLVLLLLVQAGIASAADVDVTVFGDRSPAATTVTTSVFSTNAPNELLLAFISADSTGSTVQVNAVSGAGLTWVLVSRANAQLGTAEIWRTFAASALSGVSVTATLSQSVASSITVVTFTGVDPSGTNGSGAIGAVKSASGATGAPTASLTTTRTNSWVFGVGTDWDGPVQRTLGANQTLVHQFLPAVGDTYWVQRQNGPTPATGTSVTINDTAPTNHRWDLAICEILSGTAVTYTVSGTISPPASGNGALVTLTGGTTQTTNADALGNYQFSGLGNGTFTVTPSNGGYLFTPPQQTVTIAGQSQSGVNFTGAAATGNPIVIENTRIGTSSWQLADQSYNGEIEGYAGATSVNKGGSITLYVNSHGALFTLELYRLGWYQGLGARLIAAAGTLPGQAQPACPEDPNFGTTQCAWTPSLTVNVDPAWTTGVYMAKVRRSDTGKDNYLTFVVRDDASTSEILFDSNVNTMQAYNAWGGKSLYPGLSTPGNPSKSTNNAAVKVSFDRPYQAFDFYAQNTNGEDTQFLRWEYQTVRWLESQGFDVSYSTNVDNATDGAPMLHHRIYMSAGHSEYWPSSLRDHVEAAAQAGVNLAFFTANTSYWQVRYEPSATGVANRVMVGYKDSATTFDPLVNSPSQATTKFRDPHVDRPENQLLGAMWGEASGLPGFAFVVSNSTHPFYRHTGMVNGTSMPGLIGTEWDNVNGQPESNSPPNITGLIVLSSSPTSSSIGNAVVHQKPSGALVFNVGTFQWAWGLDSTLTPTSVVDQRVGQITANILVDLGATPSTPSNVTISRTYTISGTISPPSGTATVTLSGAASRVTTTNAAGNYSFKVLANGAYTVTPTQSGVGFTPASRAVTVSGADVTGVNFTTAAPTFTLSGTITPASLGAAVQVNLTGAATASATTDGSGAYTFTGLANGTYTVTPTKAGITFTPASRNVTLNGANATANFTAASTPTTFTLSGTITPAATGANSTVTLSGAASATATANGSGAFTFSGLANGTYTVTPSKTSTTFTPANRSVTVNGANVTGVDFTAASAPATFTLSGTITPTGTGANSTVTLSGAASATTTANGSGAFTFSGLANGTYTVTPTKAATTFTPANRSVTVNGANVTGVNFTAAASTMTFTVSGTLSPPETAANSTVLLSGGASATTTADSAGNYTFTGLANGQYNVAPGKAGVTFNPIRQAVTVNGANVTGVNFAAQAATSPGLAIDVVSFKDRSTLATTIVSSAFTLNSGNELLLAFIASDSLGATVQVNSVTGGGVTWALVGRANAQLGTAEIWRAFTAAPLTNAIVTATLSQSVAASMTVLTMTGADWSGTNGSGAIGATVSRSAASGAPSASVVTTRNNSWVFGAGMDYDNAVARTLGAGQTMVHEYLATIGDTYWVQRQTSTTPAAGTSVTIDDTAPTNDRFNLIICEVIPAP